MLENYDKNDKIVGRGPVPRHATIARDRPSPYGPGRKNARGTGPRATVIERSRGTGPRATVAKTARFTVGRGTGPRHATIARDRPPRYGPEKKRGGQAPAPRNLKRSRGTGPRATVLRTAYFCRFTSPNVVSIRFAAETGPRNIRVAKVSGLPSNATSSI